MTLTPTLTNTATATTTATPSATASATATNTPIPTDTPVPATEIAPEFAAAIENNLREGSRLAEAGEFRAALEAFRRVVEIDPGNVDAQGMVGHMSFAVGDYEQALAGFTRASELNPDSLEYLLGAGDASRELGDFAAAMEFYQRVLDIDPGNTEALRLLGDTYARTGDLTAAKEAYNRAIETNPNDALTYMSQGWTSLDFQEFDQAIASFTHAVEIEAQLADEAYFGIGLALGGQRDKDGAQEAFQRALDSDPDPATCYHTLLSSGRVHLQYGEFDPAIARFQQAIETNFDDPQAQALLGLGDALFEAQRDPEALETYHQYLDQAGDEAAPDVAQRVQELEQRLAAEPAGNATTRVVVPGNADWVDSGIFVAEGQTFALTAEGGVNPCVNSDNPVCRPQGPAGIADMPAEDSYPVPGGPLVALVVRISDDGEPFLVGEGSLFTAPREGILQFRVNDEPLDNNGGEFVVTFTEPDVIVDEGSIRLPTVPFEPHMVPVGFDNFVLETQLRFAPEAEFQSAGLRVSLENEGRIEFVLAYCNADRDACVGRGIYLDVMSSPDAQVLHEVVPESAPEVFLRLTKHGRLYTAQYRTAPNNAWQTVAEFEAPASAVNAGIIAESGTNGTNPFGLGPIDAEFVSYRLFVLR